MLRVRESMQERRLLVLIGVDADLSRFSANAHQGGYCKTPTLSQTQPAIGSY